MNRQQGQILEGANAEVGACLPFALVTLLRAGGYVPGVICGQAQAAPVSPTPYSCLPSATILTWLLFFQVGVDFPIFVGECSLQTHYNNSLDARSTIFQTELFELPCADSARHAHPTFSARPGHAQASSRVQYPCSPPWQECTAGARTRGYWSLAERPEGSSAGLVTTSGGETRHIERSERVVMGARRGWQCIRISQRAPWPCRPSCPRSRRGPRGRGR